MMMRTDSCDDLVKRRLSAKTILIKERGRSAMAGEVICVAAHSRHVFSKTPTKGIHLLKGLGVEGDAHCGLTVKHRSRVAANPDQPNLRQVHLFAAEMLDELAAKGFSVQPADLGENITTRGVDLIHLPLGTRLQIGDSVQLEVTGLRNPCKQIDNFQSGLMHAVLGRDEAGNLLLRAGVMAIVLQGGNVRLGDPIHADLPPLPHRKLERV
jgi:MOSC domain-containing protein YiiM